MKRRSALPGIYMGAILTLMYLPIVLVIIYSFNESKTSSVWTGATWDWYIQLFKDGSMISALKNSVVLALASSVSAAFIGTLGAVGMSKAKLRGASAMEYISTLPIMLPEIILGMVFLAFFSLIRLPFGMLTLIISHTSFSIPYVLLLVKARLSGMDKSYEEAARDLGASELQAFLTVTLPLVAPAIVSGMLLAIAMSFDDVIISVFVTGVNTNTLPIKIYTQIKTGVTPKTNALCALLFLATVFLAILSSWLGKSKKSEMPPIEIIPSQSH
ncbi:MAG: ABC transporter permease [Clostridiales bacterium]|jgi:spermidine/putrescine transport system permease protein|nr:ABC transporter permease [Clostridiales bacterium]